jgi:mannose-6-phosphate isomerase-like protein (cupin superfamily)
VNQHDGQESGLMRIAILAPIALATPTERVGLRERVVSLLTEGLIERGVDVTLFGAADSGAQEGLRVISPEPYGEALDRDPRVLEYLQVSEVFDRAHEFDLIHNHSGSLPLACASLIDTPVLTTVHRGASSGALLVYRKCDHRTFYVSLSDSDRHSELDYIATVYPGIDLGQFSLQESQGDHLLFLERIGPETGAKEAIEIAAGCSMNLVIAGEISDQEYYAQEIEPQVDGRKVKRIDGIEPDQRCRVLGNARALLHPTRERKAFALSVLESNACGVPVIAFNSESMREFVSEGVNGFLVSSVAEAAEAVLKIDTISRHECRDFIEHRFSRDRMVDEYLKVYERILEMTKTEDRRPWGYYRVLLDRPDHKVKEIVVHPGRRLSLQQHRHRSEHWIIVSGSAVVTLNDSTMLLKPGQSVDIPVGAKHRVQNPGLEDLVFVEVQSGTYFGENDIERFEDDFGRI